MKSKNVKMCFRTSMSILAIFFALATPTWAATYYIDFDNGSDQNNGTSKSTSWKRCPGMQNFTGNYAHVAGDTFVFKGGVVWRKTSDANNSLQMSINYSGLPGTPDVYTVDKSWYNSSFYTSPVFDGQNLAASPMLYASGQNNITVDGIKLINTNGQKAIQFVGACSNLKISNNIIEDTGQGGNAIVISASSLANQANIEIFGNDISKSSNSIIAGHGSFSAYKLDNLSIHDNTIHDPGPTFTTSDHGDGIHIFGNSPPNYSITNVRVYNNRFYGDWASRNGKASATAQIYFGEGTDGGLIYNNVLGFDNKTNYCPNDYMFSPGLLYINGSRNIKIYNNTISSDGVDGSITPEVNGFGGKAGIVLFGSSTGVEIKNNIISKVEFGILSSDGSSFTSDYNLYNMRVGGAIAYTPAGIFKSLSTWRGTGNDANGIVGDPLFSNISSAPFNVSVMGSSPAKGVGANLENYFLSDILGIIRPQNIGWTIGAYEKSPGSLNAPQNLRLIH